MAVLTAAIANGGKVLWPRLVDRIEAAGPDSGRRRPRSSRAAGCGTSLGVSPRTLQILREAMLADMEDADGTGRQGARVPGMRICGKTGTAQVQDERNAHDRPHDLVCFSFAPYEQPRYAVVVMVEGGGSGGGTCAPGGRARSTPPSWSGTGRATRQTGKPLAQGRTEPPCLTPTSTNTSRALTGCSCRPVRADAARGAVRLQRDDGQRIGQLGAVVQPELVPANRLVRARDRRGGGLVLRGLPHRRPVVDGRLLGRRAAAGRWSCSAARCGSGRGGGSTWASSACSRRSLPSSRSSWPRRTS